MCVWLSQYFVTIDTEAMEVMAWLGPPANQAKYMLSAGTDRQADR